MEDEEKAVVITHFINPYQFWYYILNEESYISVRDIEEELTKYFKKNYPILRDTEIEIGSEIAVRYLPRNKFVRVRVEEVLRNQNNKKSYIVWSLDHGFAFKTQAQFCRPLPLLFTKKIDRIRRGGIEKIVPAELEYNFLKQEQETVLKEKWSKFACDGLNKMISEATDIKFTEKFNKGDQYWGDLIMYDQKGNVQHASDFLINQVVAVRSVKKFKNLWLLPKLYLAPVWQTNDGNNNYKENVSPTDLNDFPTNERIDIDLNDTDFQSAQFKVAAWQNFNKNAERNLATDNSIIENLDSTATLYDDVDDSVSKIAPNSPASVKHYTSWRNEKRNNNGFPKKVPPMPTLDDFGISEDVGATISKNVESSSVSTTSTGVSRSQYLRIMRLKHLHEKNKALANSFDTENVKKQKNNSFVNNETKHLESNSTHATTPHILDKSHLSKRFTSLSSEERLSQLDKFAVKRSLASSPTSTKILELNNDAEFNLPNKPSISKLKANTLPKMTLQNTASILNSDQRTTANQLEKFILSRRPVSAQITSCDTTNVALPESNVSVKVATTSNSLDNFTLQKNNASSTHSDESNRTIEPRAFYLKQLRLKNAQTGAKKRDEIFSERQSEASKVTLQSNNALKNAIMFPAGFDLANLNKYKNKDHWHCKETTLNEHLIQQNKDVCFTRAKTDEIKGKENLVDQNKNENTKHLTINNSSIVQAAVPEVAPQKSKQTQNSEFYDLQFSDTDEYVDVNDEDEDVNENENKNVSRASSKISMYSAESSLNESSHIIRIETSEISKTEDVQIKNTEISNPSKGLLQNFIKTTSSNIDEAKDATPTQQPIPSKQHLTSDTSQTLSSLTGDKELRLNYFQHTVLAHGTIDVKPIESLNKILLAPDVRNAMVSRGFNRVSRTQSYAWPHLLQGNSLFVINPPDSCKTWCYIPTLCTVIINFLETDLTSGTNGPLAIVLVASSDRAITVSNYCSHLLRNLKRSEAKVICSFGVRELTQTKILLMEGCAILVATPPNFRRLLEDNQRTYPLFNSQRLRHIIIDDIDVMLSRCKDDLKAVLKSLYAFAPKMQDGKKLSPQLVVTSRSYSPVLKKLIPISHQPLLVIGDFLEAAVYGKAKICFEICAKTQKIQRILEFIKEHPYKNESLMILCDRDEDVFSICEQLQLAGIDCLGCHSESTTLIRHRVHNWKLPVNIHSKVLVCTDSVLYEFEIQNVQNLIHYSLAWLWAKQKFRFSVHKETYQNLVKNNFSESNLNNKISTSLILLDEENNEELPRIVEFLKSHNQLKYLSADVIKLSNRVSVQREKERCKDDNQFCDLFFEYGECDKLSCQKRHTITEDDVNNGAKNEPLIQSGDLRMLVLNVYTPTHYAVRLLEHRPNSTADWTYIRQSNKAAAFAMKFNFFYANSDNLNRQWPLKVNDICVLDRNGSFHRVRVLKVPTLKTENVIKSIDVTIKLIDDGEILTEKSDYLYACHEQFKDFPAQSNYVRLIGLQPLDNETSWDADSTFYVKGVLMNKIQKNEIVCASVSCSLVDTIVVRNLFVMKKLPTLGNYIVSTNLKRDLVNKDYAKIDENAEQRIRNIIKDFGLELATENVNETKIAVDSQGENEQSRISMESNKSTKIELKIQANIPKKHKTETVSNIINDNVENNLRPLGSKPIKSRSETLARSSNMQYEKPETPLPKTCSFLEFLQALQRTNELDAEDYDLEADGMEGVRDYIQQTDHLCKLEIMRELEKQNHKCNEANMQAIVAATPQIPQTDELLKKMLNKQTENEVTSSTVIESEITQVNVDAMITMPPLRNVHKRPQTSWYETNQLIILSINAPDIVDYYLEVEKTFLYFKASVDGVDQVLVLNFLGTIEPQYTSHEIRGLNVIVRLVKSLFMPWPRLIKQEEKMPWLYYNLNMLNVEEMEKILPQQFIERVLNNQLSKPQNFDDTDDESDVDLETYTDIVNNDDIHDPINAERF